MNQSAVMLVCKEITIITNKLLRNLAVTATVSAAIKKMWICGIRM